MALSLKHAFTSAVADAGDATKVQPSNWNAEHSITLAADVLIGRATTPGAAQEIVCTAAGRALLDDASAAVQLATLGAAPTASPIFTGNVSQSTASTVAAAGVAQLTATGLTSDFNIVTTGTGGVRLPTGVALNIAVINRTSSAVSVYPPTGGTLDGLLNTAVVIPATGGSGEYTSDSTGLAWFSRPPVALTQGASDNSTNIATTAWARAYAPSGIYTPAPSNVANCASFTSPHYGQYHRVGNIVFFTLQITVTPTTVSTLTSFLVTLPVASTFAATTDCFGVGNVNVANTGAWVVRCDTATNKIFVSYIPSATGAQGVRVSGSYIVA